MSPEKKAVIVHQQLFVPFLLIPGGTEAIIPWLPFQDYPFLIKAACLAKHDYEMPLTTSSAAKALDSPNSGPFTSIIFCTMSPSSERNQSFILSGTYTLPWITVTHKPTPVSSSSSGAYVFHPMLNFLYIRFLLLALE